MFLAEQTVIACDFSTQKGLSLTDGMCAFSQEGGEWFRTNEKTSQYGPSGDHTNGTSELRTDNLPRFVRQ